MKAEERRARLVPLLREVLTVLGEDPTREGVRDTPNRWADALLSYTAGLWEDPEMHLKRSFLLDDDRPAPSDDLVLVANTHFVSVCEEHMAPLQGVAHVAYIPNPEVRVVVGLSKITRVVQLYARRLQTRERMTEQIADAIDRYLRPAGVLVLVEAPHACREEGGEGPRPAAASMVRRGAFLDNPFMELKFYNYLRLQSGAGAI